MNRANALPRSPELMSRSDTGLLIVDVQTKLINLIPGHKKLVWNISRLISAAQVLGMPVAATEQDPQGLGTTVPELAAQLTTAQQGEIPSKLDFSCGECGDVFRQFQEQGVDKLLLVGIEAHVCVGQTAMDLLAAGFRIYLAVDAVGSRHLLDAEVALRRLDAAGAVLTTTEAALFEWCQRAGSPEFKHISQLVRQLPPVE